MIELFEHDEFGVFHVVALSGGHDSTVLAVLLQEQHPNTPFNFICTPTGDELPEMFAHWRNLGERLGRRIIPVMNGTLKSVAREQRMLPNFRARFCTRILKIEPFRKVLSALTQRGLVISYVGLRAGGAYDDIPGVVMRFPLREWDMGEDEVQTALRERGIKCPDRTDCARCYHQRLGEWYELWMYHPELAADAVRDEEEIGGTYRTPGRDQWPTALKDLFARFAAGDVPAKSLTRMYRERMDAGACRVCSL